MYLLRLGRRPDRAARRRDGVVGERQHRRFLRRLVLEQPVGGLGALALGVDRVEGGEELVAAQAVRARRAEHRLPLERRAHQRRHPTDRVDAGGVEPEQPGREGDALSLVALERGIVFRPQLGLPPSRRHRLRVRRQRELLAVGREDVAAERARQRGEVVVVRGQEVGADDVLAPVGDLLGRRGVLIERPGVGGMRDAVLVEQVGVVDDHVEVARVGVVRQGVELAVEPPAVDGALEEVGHARVVALDQVVDGVERAFVRRVGEPFEPAVDEVRHGAGREHLQLLLGHIAVRHLEHREGDLRVGVGVGLGLPLMPPVLGLGPHGEAEGGPGPRRGCRLRDGLRLRRRDAPRRALARRDGRGGRLRGDRRA